MSSTVLAGGRLALGLLTVLPVGAVATDRRTARTALLLAPAVGAALGGLAWAAGALVDARDGGPLLAAVAGVGVLAVSTRALHLDGLADVADGLGSARPAEQALEVMKRSDVGPFGVAALVLVLLAQVAALAQAWAVGLAGPVLVLACATGRLALLWACRAGVPAARPDGLGALVAGVVPSVAALLLTLVVGAGAAAWGLAHGPGSAVGFAAGVVAGLLAGGLLLRRAVRRFGGVTGDVLGAVVETATTAAAVVLLLG